MRNWSIVRIGATTTHKKLFFQLRYLKRSLEKVDTSYFEPDTANAIAKNLQISVHEVQAMHDRLIQKDKYLDQKIHADYEVTFSDMLADECELIDSVLINEEEKHSYMAMYEKLHEFLNERELDILMKRRIDEPPKTLEEVSVFHGVTRERVRQIEKQVIKKLQKSFIFKGSENRLYARV
jgi:RNA polymerase sigma-32 factor